MDITNIQTYHPAPKGHPSIGGELRYRSRPAFAALQVKSRLITLSGFLNSMFSFVVKLPEPFLSINRDAQNGRLCFL